MGKLTEFGLIENASSVLTTKGFEVAMDSYDGGLRLSDKDIIGFLKALNEIENPDEMAAIHFLINELQDLGFEEFKNKLAKTTNQ